MQPVVLLNARLIDPDQPASGLTNVRIEGKRIAAVGAGVAASPDARVIDLKGCSVMPGMYSCHFHATYDPAGMMRGLPAGLEAPPTLLTLRAARNVRLALEAGFTGVVSAGASFAIDAALKKAVETDLIEGPRIMAGSRDVSTTGHSQDDFYPWYWTQDNPGVLACDGPDSIARGVRTEIKRGAEIIKMFVTPGHGVPGGETGRVDLTQAELNAATEAAHQRGAKVRGHISNLPGIEAALDAGFDVIDHGDGLNEACVERMVKAGTFLAPSMLYAHLYGLSNRDSLADVMNHDLEGMLKVLPIANKAGVKIVLGDDFGSPTLEHGDYAKELDYYVNVVGIPAQDVLRWATRNGAELMDRGHELGAIRPGYLADLLVVQGDPLADIRVLLDKSRILAIVKDGAFFKDDLAALKAVAKPAELVAAE